LACDSDFHVNRKSATWDRRLYFPSEGRHDVDFFRLKNPTASAGFEPEASMLTTRPPKPLSRATPLLSLRVFVACEKGVTYLKNQCHQKTSTSQDILRIDSLTPVHILFVGNIFPQMFHSPNPPPSNKLDTTP
jgi:hypothetical protein